MVYSALPNVARVFFSPSPVVCYTAVAIRSSYLEGRRHVFFKPK